MVSFLLRVSTAMLTYDIDIGIPDVRPLLPVMYRNGRKKFFSLCCNTIILVLWVSNIFVQFRQGH